jgi:hypothetical protein
MSSVTLFQEPWVYGLLGGRLILHLKCQGLRTLRFQLD